VNGKRLVTVLLLAFVAVSVAWLVYRAVAAGPTSSAPAQLAGAPAVSGATSATPGATGAPVAAAASGATAPAAAAGPRFAVFYVHGTRRCHTCTTMEAYAEEAVRTAFAGDLETGRVTWRAVNIEEPGNERLATDFQVAGSTLLVAELAPGGGDRALRYRKLDRIWDHVDDRARFQNYVADEVEAFVAGPAAATDATGAAGEGGAGR